MDRPDATMKVQIWESGPLTLWQGVIFDRMQDYAHKVLIFEARHGLTTTRAAAEVPA